MEKEEILEEFGQCLDKIDNLIAAMRMSLPDYIHLDALREALPELKGRLKQVYFELGGENVWD